MKKPYSKATIVFESFALSKTIASGCAFISNHEMFSCSVKTDTGTLFADAVMCAGGYYPPEGWNSVCYDNSSDDKAVFTS